MRMHSRVVTAFSLLVFGVFGNSTTSARDDFEFANGLARLGYFDLAQEHFEYLKSKGKAADAEFGLCRLKSMQAKFLPNIEEKMKGYDQAMDCFRAYARKYPRNRNREARLEVADIQQQKGRHFKYQMETTSNEESRSEFRKRASKEFVDAAKEYRTIYKSRSVSEDLKAESWYLAVESLTLAGEVLEKGNADRRKHFEAVVIEAEEFVWEYEPQIIAYYCYVLQGQAYAGLGKWREARNAFTAVIEIDLDQEAPEVKQMAAPLLLKAYHAFIRGMVENGQFKVGVEEGEAMVAKFPNATETFSGQGGTYELARAYYGAGEAGKAMNLVTQLIEKGGYFGELSKVRISEWHGGGAIDAKTGFKMATGYIDRRAFDTAIDRFRQVLQAKSDSQEQAEFHTAAWELIGYCFYKREQFQEAALAYQHAVDLSEKLLKEDLGKELKAELGKRREEGAYWRYVSLKAASRVSGDSEDGLRENEARDRFTRTFPNSPRKDDLEYYAGLDLEEMAGNGDFEKFRDAIAKYESISNQAETYEQALFRIGFCWYDYGRNKKPKDPKAALTAFQKSEEAFESYRAYTVNPKNQLLSRRMRATREEQLTKTVLVLGAILLEQNKFEKAITTYTEEGGGAIRKELLKDRRYVPRVLKDLVKCSVGVGRKTIAELNALSSKTDEVSVNKRRKLEPRLPENRDQVVFWAEQLLSTGARHLEYYAFLSGKFMDEVGKARAGGDSVAADKALEFYSVWFDQKRQSGGKMTFTNTYVIAKRLADTESPLNLDRAAKIFGFARTLTKDETKRDGCRFNEARCFLRAKKWQKALGIYYSLYKNPRNRKRIGVVRGICAIFMAIGEKPEKEVPADEKLFGQLVEIRKGERLALLDAFKAKEVSLDEMKNAYADLKSDLQERQGKGRLRRKRFLADMGDDATEIQTQYRRTLDELSKLWSEEVTKSVDERRGAIKRMCLDRATSLYQVLSQKTTRNGIEKDLRKFNDFSGIPTNPDWWDARYNLIRCYKFRGSESGKEQALDIIDNLELLYLRRDEEEAKWKAGMAKDAKSIRERIAKETDAKRKALLEKRYQSFVTVMEMLIDYKNKIKDLK